MTAMTVNLKITKSHQEIIYLPSALIQKLELQPNRIVSLHFGIGNTRRVKVRPFKSKEKEIILTSALKEALLLPYRKKIMVKREKDGLHIGPIIGILTTDFTGNKFANPDTREHHPFSIFFKHLLAPEPLYPAFYFVFTPDHVDWQRNRIHGYFYLPTSNQKKSWKLVSVPFPDVVYNRIPNRTIERKETIHQFKQNYLKMGGQIFNPNFFSKWDMVQILANDPITIPYIPETYINPSSSLLQQMVKKHPIVYLKPANGSLGLGIYKILKENNDYIVHYRNGNQNKSLLFKDIVSLYKYIFSRKNRQRYLIQQGIDLIEYQQNPVDFRIQLHKNQFNEWQVIAIGGKAAGRGSVTTHIRTGGQLIDSFAYLENVFHEHTATMQQRINQASIQIAKKVEEKINSPIGELGLDIGIDKNHQIWLFEVNSKPGRSIFKHPSLKSARMVSSKYLLEYAIYLAKFSTISAS